MTYNTTNIDKVINDNINAILSLKVFGDNFYFRLGQREAIFAIAKAYMTKSHNTIVLDAPTGSGKSVIAMFVSLLLIALGKHGYIITSDLMLQEQYWRDFQKHLFKWGNIKGMDNYICSINNEIMSLSHCHTRHMSTQEIQQLECYATCPYYLARRTAITAKLSLLNYSYWLLQMNYVKPKLEKPPFDDRNFTIFDEAHNIDKIVQSHFAVPLHKNFHEHVQVSKSFFERTSIYDAKQLVAANKIEELYLDLKSDNNKQQVFKKLQVFKNFVSTHLLCETALYEYLQENFPDRAKDDIPAEISHVLKSLNRIHDVYCKVDDYLQDMSVVGIHNIVKIENDDSIEFKTTAERALIQDKLLKQSNFKVLMSATFGDPSQYSRLIGLSSDVMIIRIPHTFDFSKSPIYKVGNVSLSYKNKHANLPTAVALIDKCLDIHIESGQNGIIHTGNYEFTKALMSMSRHSGRFLTYNDSVSKHQAIAKFKTSNAVTLIGPSLLEGLDLPEDLCRYQVFMKVPYPNLGDALVQAKLENDPTWYTYKTSLAFQQGLGRGNRTPTDWCVTYLIDSDFNMMLAKSNLPTYITNRIFKLDVNFD